MLTYVTEPPPLVADLSYTHAQYLPFKRSILRAERTKKSSVRNSRVLRGLRQTAHTQQVKADGNGKAKEKHGQSLTFMPPKSHFNALIKPLRRSERATIGVRKSQYRKPEKALQDNKPTTDTMKSTKNVELIL